MEGEMRMLFVCLAAATGSKVLNITTPGGRVIATTTKASNVVTVNPKTLHLTAVKSAAGGTTGELESQNRRLALNLLACSKPQNLWQVDWLVGRWPGCGGTCRKMFSKKNLMNGTQADQLLSKDCQGLEGPSPADGQSSYPWCFFFPSTRVLKPPPLKPAPFCPSPSRLDIVCPWFCLLSECCSVFFSSFVFLSLVLMFAWLAVGLGLCIRFFWGLHLGLWPKCSKPSELSVSFFFSVSVILSFNQCYLHKH